VWPLDVGLYGTCGVPSQLGISRQYVLVAFARSSHGESYRSLVISGAVII
jgi:hypothetical protein